MKTNTTDVHKRKEERSWSPFEQQQQQRHLAVRRVAQLISEHLCPQPIDLHCPRSTQMKASDSTMRHSSSPFSSISDMRGGIAPFGISLFTVTTRSAPVEQIRVVCELRNGCGMSFHGIRSYVIKETVENNFSTSLSFVDKRPWRSKLRITTKSTTLASLKRRARPRFAHPLNSTSHVMLHNHHSACAQLMAPRAL